MHESVKGSINGEFTLNIDLAPTLLSAAEIEVPGYMQGRDMAALYSGDNYEQAQKEWRKDFFYEFSWRGKDIRPAPASFISPNPPVFALISKVYKVRRAIVRIVASAQGWVCQSAAPQPELTGSDHFVVHIKVLLLAAQAVPPALPHPDGPLRGAGRDEHHRSLCGAVHQGPLRAPPEPEPERTPRVDSADEQYNAVYVQSILLRVVSTFSQYG
jgi:hypothetical protein